MRDPCSGKPLVRFTVPSSAKTRILLNTPNARIRVSGERQEIVASAALIALASPVDQASEHAWLEWYSNVHIPEIRAAIPEVSNVVQFRHLVATEALPRYTTIYEATGIDAAAVAQQLGAAAPTLTQTDLMAVGSDAPVVYFTDIVS